MNFNIYMYAFGRHFMQSNLQVYIQEFSQN